MPSCGQKRTSISKDVYIPQPLLVALSQTEGRDLGDFPKIDELFIQLDYKSEILRKARERGRSGPHRTCGNPDLRPNRTCGNFEESLTTGQVVHVEMVSNQYKKGVLSSTRLRVSRRFCRFLSFLSSCSFKNCRSRIFVCRPLAIPCNVSRKSADTW